MNNVEQEALVEIICMNQQKRPSENVGLPFQRTNSRLAGRFGVDILPFGVMLFDCGLICGGAEGSKSRVGNMGGWSSRGGHLVEIGSTVNATMLPLTQLATGTAGGSEIRALTASRGNCCKPRTPNPVSGYVEQITEVSVGLEGLDTGTKRRKAGHMLGKWV